MLPNGHQQKLKQKIRFRRWSSCFSFGLATKKRSAAAPPALKNGGKFLLDVRNPDYIFGKIRNGENAALKPHYTLSNNGYVEIKEEMIEPNIWRVIFDWKIDGDGIGNTWQAIRLYNLEELTEMLKAAKFKVEKVWGDYTGEDYNLKTSKRIIILAQKIVF